MPETKFLVDLCKIVLLFTKIIAGLATSLSVMAILPALFLPDRDLPFQITAPGRQEFDRGFDCLGLFELDPESG